MKTECIKQYLKLKINKPLTCIIFIHHWYARLSNTDKHF